MVWFFIAILFGINFAPWIFTRFPLRDAIWYSHIAWGFFSIFALWSYSFFEKPKNFVKNIPLSLLSAWVILRALFLCYMLFTHQKNPIDPFMQLFNFITVLIFYKLCIEYLTPNRIRIIVRWIKYGLIACVLFCVLQYFNLSQYFRLLYKNPFLRNPVVGFIGNGTILSGFLAMCLPFFFEKKRESVFCALSIIVVLFFTSTTPGDVAATGIATSIAVFGYYLFYKNRDLFYIYIASVIGVGAILYNILPEKKIALFLNDNGRIGFLKYYWKMFHELPLTGKGLGAINIIHKKTEFPNLVHLHLEYFHFAFELGLIGFVLIANVILDFFRKHPVTDLEIRLRAVVFGFCVACLFNSFAHIFIPSIYLVFAYSSSLILRKENNVKP